MAVGAGEVEVEAEVGEEGVRVEEVAGAQEGVEMKQVKQMLDPFSEDDYRIGTAIVVRGRNFLC